MYLNVQKAFARIGAKVEFVSMNGRPATSRSLAGDAPMRVNIITEKRKEMFQIAVHPAATNSLEMSVLELKVEDRHLVLLARLLDNEGHVVSKDHFLCGHDERHFFVASVDSVSTVAAAKDSLRPPELLDKETGLNVQKRNRRKTRNFRRQGEWFFIPAAISPEHYRVLRYEPLRRGRSKPHIAQFAYRAGGEAVKVCSQYPNGITMSEYAQVVQANPNARYFHWRDMQRGATVYVKGTIRHPDHATVVLDGWHRVLLNNERQVEAVAFLD